MLKLLNAQQLKAWDAYTMVNEPVSSIDLMERACVGFVKWFVQTFETALSVGVVCGTGNNGGDGLGIARLLHDRGFSVNVWIVKGTVPETEGFKTNLARLPVKAEEIFAIEDINPFSNCKVLIDAIFGYGLSREVEGIYKQAIEAMNHTRAIRVAVDIPSGLFADVHTQGMAVNADYTLTFQLPKLAFLMPENSDSVGEWIVVDIGLHKNFLKDVKANHWWVTKKLLNKKIPKRGRFDHKGVFGRGLILAGSMGKMGAAVLAARAALRSGLGLLTVHVPKCGYQIIQTTVPEAMASVDTNENSIATAVDIHGFDAVALGPGLGQNPATVAAVSGVLRSAVKPMVIDADGLNILSQHRDLFPLIPENSILTPHGGEFQRMVGSWKNDFERLSLARDFSKNTRCILVLKGAYTAIVFPDGQTYFNSTGNPGMATAGSGDVLTGILTGLLAQGIPPQDAAIVGVYLHGLAGDRAALAKGFSGLIASDLVDELPQAFKQLSR